MHDSLTPAQFERLASLIQAHGGYHLSAAKKAMVEGRLRRRVLALGLPSLGEYCRRLFEDGLLETEYGQLVKVVATERIGFFHDPEQFRLLAEHVLPGWTGGDRPLKAWSTAGSIGAEPYALAMVLDSHARTNPGFRFGVLATDSAADMLERARLGIYPEAMLRAVPPDWRCSYFQYSRDPRHQAVRVVPAIRRAVRFRCLDLMDDRYPLATDLDIMFCRDTLIRLDGPNRERVLRRLCGHLRPGGLLFLGKAETASGVGLPVRQVAPAIFARI